MRAGSSYVQLILLGFTCSFLQTSIINISSMILQKVKQYDTTVWPHLLTEQRNGETNPPNLPK